MTPDHECRLALITDPHLDFGDLGPLARHFPSRGYTAALVTGDIAAAGTVRSHIHRLQQHLGCPVFFVLGNHDYWGSSFDAVARQMAAPPAETAWLRTCPPIELVPGTVLTGHDGWYDGRAGVPEATPVMLRDFFLVADLKQHAKVKQTVLAGMLHTTLVDRHDLLLKLRETADIWAQEAEEKLEQALAMKPKRLFFATHVPPFPWACWHEGKMSNALWQPWFVNTALGHVLARVAEENRDVDFDVFCGHTHSPGLYRHSHNLVVRTGESQYGSPRVYDVLTLTA